MLLAITLLIEFSTLLFIYGALGFGWSGLVYRTKTARLSFAPVVGLALHLVVIVTANYMGWTFDKMLWPQAGIIVALGMAGYFFVRNKASLAAEQTHDAQLWPLLLLAGIVFMAGVAPLIFKLGHHGSVHYYSRDYFFYWAQAHWLQSHSIGHLGGGVVLNPIAVQAYWSIVGGLRIGSQLWTAFLTSLFHCPVEDIFTVLVSFAIAMQAMLVAQIVGTVTKKGLLPALVIGILYGLHPVIQWSGFAAFYPQNVGLVLALGILLLFLSEKCWTAPLRLGFVAGLLMAALWSAYSEITPILALLCGGVTLMRFAQGRLAWKDFGWFFFGGLLVFGAAAGPTFCYFARGLRLQIHWNIMSAEQSTRWWALLGAFFGFWRMPVEPSVVDKTHDWLKLLIMAGVLGTSAIALSRMGKLVRKGVAWMTLAVFATLMVYCEFRYAGIPRYWGFFKSVNYAVPFLFAWVLLALLTLEGWWRMLWLFFVIPYAVGEESFWCDVMHECQFVSSCQDKQSKTRDAFIKSLPTGSFYVTRLPNEIATYSAYGPLVERDFITDSNINYGSYGNAFYEIVDDGVNTDLLSLEGMTKCLSSCHAGPVRYVLTGHGPENEFPGKVVYKDDSYKIIDLQDHAALFPIMLSHARDEAYFYLSRSASLKDDGITIVCPRAQDLRMTLTGESLGKSIQKNFEVNSEGLITGLRLPLEGFSSRGILINFKMVVPCPLELRMGPPKGIFMATVNPLPKSPAPQAEFAVAPPSDVMIDSADSDSIVFAWYPSPTPGDNCYNLCYGPSAGNYTNMTVTTSFGATRGGIENILPGTWHFAIRTVHNGRYSNFSPDIVYPIASANAVFEAGN